LWDCFFDPGKDNKDFVFFDDNPSVRESLSDNKERNMLFDG
jgi:hypothetical protein